MIAKSIAVIDIGDSEDLGRLIDKVGEARGSVILSRGGHEVAILSPLTPEHIPAEPLPHKEVTEEDRAAFRAAAGGWKDFDSEAFLEQNRASREANTDPPVDQ